MILGTGTVDAIYRFTGQNINYNINECLFLLSETEPQIFSKRGVVNLKQLSKTEYCDSSYSEKYLLEDALVISHRREPEESRVFDTLIYVQRRNKERLENREPEWIQYFHFAKEHGSRSLKKIMEDYESTHGNENAHPLDLDDWLF
jgi:hypothetical protein